MIALAALAHAAPVLCDPADATQLLTEARIEERRAPVTHPELVPGLALASDDATPQLKTALRGLCTEDASLGVAAGASWETAGWSAHTVRLTSSRQEGCALVQRALAISVTLHPGEAPRYGLRSTLPPTRTPVGEACDVQATWREERVLDGAEGPARAVLALDLDDSGVRHSQVLARRATPDGWIEQVLIEPAPERVIHGGDGPRFSLAGDWIVAHADRITQDGTCQAVGGTAVWVPDADGWTLHAGREANALLASIGQWRLSSDDGWLLIVGVGDEDDRDVLSARARRLQERTDEPLSILQSAHFPGLNPGFLVITPPPWPDREPADLERKRWPRRIRAYVKQAWKAGDACEIP